MSVQEIPENYDDTLDKAALNNYNADWVNMKGESALGQGVEGFRSHLKT